MTADDVDRLAREVIDGNADAFLPLADEMMGRGHPHGEELVELAATIGFHEDPACVFVAGATFMMLANDDRGRLPKGGCCG